MIGADLGPQLERFVAKLVGTGRCNSKSEVMGEGIIGFRNATRTKQRPAALRISG